MPNGDPRLLFLLRDMLLRAHRGEEMMDSVNRGTVWMVMRGVESQKTEIDRGKTFRQQCTPMAEVEVRRRHQNRGIWMARDTLKQSRQTRCRAVAIEVGVMIDSISIQVEGPNAGTWMARAIPRGSRHRRLYPAAAIEVGVEAVIDSVWIPAMREDDESIGARVAMC